MEPRSASAAQWLFEASQVLLDFQDLPATLRTIAAKTRELLGTTHAQILLWDEATQTLTLGAADGSNVGVCDRLQYGLDRGVSGVVARTRQPLIVNDYQHWPHRFAALSDDVADIGVPLIACGRFLGVLTSCSIVPGTQFDEEHLRLLGAFAAQAAVAIENARLHDDAERTSAEARLRLQGLVLDQISDKVTVTDLDGVITYVNRAESQVLKRRPDELIGRHVSSYGEDASRGATQEEILETVRTQGEWRGEVVNYAADGKVLILDCRVSQVRDTQGRPVALCGIATDITDRKQIETALRTSEERYRRLFEEATEGIALAEADTGLLVDCNRAFELLTGYSRSELIGRPQAMLHPPETGDPAVTQSFALHRRTHDGQTLPTIVVTKGGSIKQVEIKAHTLSLDGRPIVQGFFRDVTDAIRHRRERETTLHLLRLLNDQNHTHELIREVTRLLQEWTGCEAVGVRLQDGDDFPYFETRGFPAEFVEAERSLCLRDAAGTPVRDSDGNPVLECMCGSILCGRFDPALPFFTLRGSFWSNCTTALLASTSEADRQARTRNRCNGEGYESVALIPLRHAGRTLGLLQLNDHAAGRFTPELLAFLENTADQIAIALAQRQAQAALRESEEFRETIFDSEAAHIAVLSPNGTIMAVNLPWTRFALENAPTPGTPLHNGGVGTNYLEICRQSTGKSAEEAAQACEGIRQVLEGRAASFRLEYPCHSPDQQRWFILTATPLKGGGGAVVSHANISELKLAELALQSSQAELRAIYDSAPLMICLLDEERRLLYANRALVEYVGLPQESLEFQRACGFLECLNALEDPQGCGFGSSCQSCSLRLAMLDTARTGAPHRDVEHITRIRRNGQEADVVLLGSTARVQVGAQQRLVLCLEDITERRRNEAALREHEALLRAMERIAKIGGWEWDVAARTMTWTDGTYGLHGFDRAEIAPGSDEHIARSLACYAPEDRPLIQAAFSACVERGTPYDLELRFTSATGRRLWIRTAAQAVLSHGRVAKVVGHIMDVTDRREAEAAQALLHMAVEQSAECIVVTDAAGTIQYVNPTFERVTGYTRAEAIGENPRLLKSGKQEAAFYRAMWDRLSRGESWTGTFVNRRKDGRLYEEQAVISPVKNAEGRTTHYVAVKRDVTHEREMEVQLQQAQRMEAIGRLAGGIAHDFNNLLFLILGSAKLLQEERPGLDPQARDLLDEIQNAGTRAAELTEQLLAFSRKQPRQPKVFDLNDSLTGLRKMLTRALGEKVRLATAFTAAPAQVHFDPGQLEQVVLNLALNARDAMPDGGTLTIETANVDGGNGEDGGRAGRPLQGPAVLLTVRDTGLGMESDTLAHLFEPFYTTKGRGKGTGLGLAIVYGIVEQNGGAIWVQSVPGQGTTFRICLPLAGPDSAAEGTPAAHPAARGGTETILVVEDEAPVRQLATRMLRRLGYTVLEAGSGPEALAFVAQHRGTIELLLTDVIMPEMNGPEVARRLTASHPETRVLYMSGYLGDELSGKADLDPQTTLLRKPFTPGDLAQRIRQMLES